MKKMIVLLAVVAMSIGASAWAADEAINPKLEQAKELRVQATKASMQAAKLLEQAKELELEAMRPKPGEKMRGGDFICFSACIYGNHGDNSICKIVCGF